MPMDNSAHIDIKLAGDSYPATFLSGSESISTPYAFQVEFLAPYNFKVRDFPGTQVILKFTAADGQQRRLSGLIKLIEETGSRLENIKKKLIRISVVSRLSLLEQHSDQRILLGRTAIDIVKETLERHGYKPEQLKFRLGEQPPVHPYTLQVEQSDFDFIQRVLARDGIFYYFDCETHNNFTYEVIHFLNATSYCHYLDRKMIRYYPSSGMSQTIDGNLYTSLFKIQEHQSLVSSNWSFHDYNDQTPETTLFKSRQSNTHGKLKNVGHQSVYGQGTLSLDNVDKQARYAAERAIVRSHHISASGDVADIAAGRITSIDASKFEGRLTADYLITRVDHYLNHRPAHDLTESRRGHDNEHKASADSPDYHCEITAIKREVNYRPELPPRPEIPLTFSARVESEGHYASLDNQGRYNLRKLLDMGERPHTQAITPPLRKLQPFGGPMQVFTPDKNGEIPASIPTGMHCPLQDGDEVLLSCLNGDPDRPMIVGSHFDANRSNLVNKKNKNQNRWKSSADNEFLMDDKIDDQVIQMRTYEGFNILQFDAKKAENQIRLATEHGSIHLFAKQTFHEKSGGTHEERSGNKRLQVVENKSFTKTKKGEIHYQTPTDNLQNAGYNIKYKTDKNIEMDAKQHQIIVVEDENMEITVEGSGGFRIHVKNDELHIQTAKEIRIEGQGGGDITFHQSGGGFCVTKGGDVKLFGQDIQIEGDQGVTLNGNVSYTITSPPPGPKPKPAAALKVAPIKKLLDDKIKIYGNHWLTQISPVGEPVGLTFRTTGMGDKTRATIIVYEKDFAGQDKVDEFQLTLEQGTGTHTTTWKRPESLLLEDAKKDKQQGETGPLEYIFKVKASATESELSPVLWFQKDIEISFKKPQSASASTSKPNNKEPTVANGTIMELRDPLNDYYEAEVKDDKVLFPRVLVGATKVRKRNLTPGKPAIYDLSWSHSKVSVGHSVNVSFRARNFNADDNIKIDVYETDNDGSRSLVDTLKSSYKLGTTSYIIQWKYKEESIDEQLQEDIIKREIGPLTFIFEVTIKRTGSDISSNELLFTRDLTFKLRDKNNQSVADGIKVHIISPDKIQYTELSNNGSVTFNNITVGEISKFWVEGYQHRDKN